MTLEQDTYTVTYGAIHKSRPLRWGKEKVGTSVKKGFKNLQKERTKFIDGPIFCQGGTSFVVIFAYLYVFALLNRHKNTNVLVVSVCESSISSYSGIESLYADVSYTLFS